MEPNGIGRTVARYRAGRGRVQQLTGRSMIGRRRVSARPPVAECARCPGRGPDGGRGITRSNRVSPDSSSIVSPLRVMNKAMSDKGMSGRIVAGKPGRQWAFWEKVCSLTNGMASVRIPIAATVWPIIVSTRFRRAGAIGAEAGLRFFVVRWTVHDAHGSPTRIVCLSGEGGSDHRD